MRPDLPLSGITVVEFSTSVAGPYAGMVLAELGADVLKVENPNGGDDARHWGPPFVNGVSPVFNALNRNKRSVTVDLKNEARRGQLRDFIAAHADVVIQNLRPGLMAKFGLDAQTLRAESPSLIYCDMHAFGATGPKRNQPGYDPLMQACSGIMSVTGIEGQEPVRVGPSIVDQGNGMWAAMAVITALFDRERTGLAQTVSSSLYETAVGWLPAHFALYLASGKSPGRIGSENPGIAPYKAYEAQDGWLVIAAGNDRLFGRLAEALGAPGLAQDTRFLTNPKRVENRAALNGEVQRIVGTRPRDQWLAALEAAGVPSAPVLGLDEVLADPQLEALGILQEDPAGQARSLGLPISFDGERPPLRSGPPALGNATEHIMAASGQGRK